MRFFDKLRQYGILGSLKKALNKFQRLIKAPYDKWRCRNN
jgi:hypothetical protein